MAQEWLQHVARTQAHKFIAGVAPIRSVVRVGGAVAGLLAVPAAALGGAGSGGGGGGLSVAAAAGKIGAIADSELSRQLRRSTAGFVRALVFEALGLGAAAAAGAQAALAGGAPPPAAEPPPGVAAALRAAAGELAAGFGAAKEAVRARAPPRRAGERWQDAALRALRAAPAAAAPAASATAAAVRYALLGVRSAIDPDRVVQ